MIEEEADIDLWHPGVANLGWRPTVGSERIQLEVHLFDFDRDLYGSHLRVRLLAFLRPEKKFDGLEGLRAQIAEDGRRARALLAAEDSDTPQGRSERSGAGPSRER